MNQEDINKLPPDELRVEVAKALGWYSFEYIDDDLMAYPSGGSIDKVNVPNYQITIGDAWQIINTIKPCLEDFRLSGVKGLRSREYTYICELLNDKAWKAYGKTEAEAICKAFLCMVGDVQMIQS